MNMYITQNASFLHYTPAQTAAACLLLTMKLTGLIELYGSYHESEDASPTLVWDKSIEKLTGLLFHEDI